jgi:malate synthase
MSQMISGLSVNADLTTEMTQILTPEALEFVRQLQTRFGTRRTELLAARETRQERIEAGEMPDFLEQTRHIRNDATWRVPPPPKDLMDRRAEITGPVDRKMVINALNSGAKVFMADFEDANSPSWSNCVLGQINLRDAIRRTIGFINPDGKQYALNEKTATLKVRPRGWHLPEKHVTLEGEAISGGLFDFGLYVFHNAKELLARGSGPYFYLPKLESHLEARLWNDVFTFAEEYVGIAHGSIRATVLIETILAAFEMEEILYELRDHSVGLNCGRWDYIFSTIKKFRLRPDFVMPDRVKVTMTSHMMRSYSLLAIKTCHKRGAHAIGGMSAFIPVKNDIEANNKATEQVRTDKTREATDGHDGTWVAHPGLVPVALEVFDRIMPNPNQIDRQLELNVSATDLLTVPTGGVTLAGLTLNISVALQYLEAWLNGSGAVPINNLMEDAATAEISRAQIWQWIYHHTKLEDGSVVTLELVKNVLNAELERLGRERFAKAAGLLLEVATAQPFIEFLTLPGYREMA